MPDPTRRIVCAAIQNSDGVVILGVRHMDAQMCATIDLRKRLNPLEDWHASDQGFVNTWGEFLSREEAWKVAKHYKQIIRLCGGQTLETMDAPSNQLYSENLY